MSGLAVAEFEDVGMVYPTGFLGQGRRLAVEHVSLRINPGEVFAPAWAKSGWKNHAGQDSPVAVPADVGAGPAFQRPLAERQTLARVGYVHENPAFPRYLSAVALLEYYGALALLPEPVARRRAALLLDMVGLADRGHEPISCFSKGMVQRLAIAQALLNDPELLVLDEPSEGLDLPGRRLVRDVIRERRRRGFTVLLVSHVVSEVEQVCDRVGVLVGGHLVYSGTVADLARDHKTGAPCPIEQALDRLYFSSPIPSAAEEKTGEGPRSWA